jgi:hypothetical protein
MRRTLRVSRSGVDFPATDPRCTLHHIYKYRSWNKLLLPCRATLFQGNVHSKKYSSELFKAHIRPCTWVLAQSALKLNFACSQKHPIFGCCASLRQPDRFYAARSEIFPIGDREPTGDST